MSELLYKAAKSVRFTLYAFRGHREAAGLDTDYLTSDIRELEAGIADYERVKGRENTPRYTHRIRRCKGNRQAWCLIALREDGSEIESYEGFVTNESLDNLLKYAKGLLPTPADVVQIVYEAKV